jgi:hypothetical protein
MRKNDILPFHLDPEQLEDGVFRALREQPEKEQCKRVEALLSLFAKLRADASTRTKMEAVTGLRNRLSRYKWTFQVFPWRDRFYANWTAGDKGLEADDAWEYRAVQLLLEMVPYLGKSPRIRRCEECNAWFFAATREDQRWCNRNCRQRHYDSSPETRESKKLYMREYRATMKKLARNPKSGVGLRGSRRRPGGRTGR